MHLQWDKQMRSRDKILLMSRAKPPPPFDPNKHGSLLMDGAPSALERAA